jgi:hypothetical protein
LGLIDERTALEELFSVQNRVSGLDLALIDSVWDLLRNQEGRALFLRYLSGFTGVITRDTDYDGIPEGFARYENGILTVYQHDGKQSGLADLVVNFEDANPKSAVVDRPPEAGAGIPVFPRKAEEPRKILIEWEQYPAIREAEIEGERFFFRPLELFFAPVQFLERGVSYSSGTVTAKSFLFPERDPMTPALTRRTLLAHAYRLERPSTEFRGALEVMELSAGIPIRAREYLNGLMLSETDFLRGRPIAQKVDLDMDGRLETFRHFRRTSIVSEGALPSPETLLNYERDFDYVESDWNGNGNFIREYFP